MKSYVYLTVFLQFAGLNSLSPSPMHVACCCSSALLQITIVSCMSSQFVIDRVVNTSTIVKVLCVAFV